MRSWFFGNKDQISRVYSAEIIDALSLEAGLEAGRVYDVKDLGGVVSEDVEYLFSTWGMPPVPSEYIRSYFPALKAVFYAAGSVQSFAGPFLSEGVKVFSAWGANAVPVAEYACSQILLANKGFFHCFRQAGEGRREEALAAFSEFPGNFDCPVGIIGAGMIGSAVAVRLKEHRLNVYVFDPFLPPEKAAELGVTKVSLEEIFAKCRTVSNHLANNARTAGMLRGDLFGSMMPFSTFINTGRGAQVDEQGLAGVLARRKDIVALLDVTWPEPPEAGHPFYSLDNVFLTPHMAGSSGNEVKRMAEYMLAEFRKFSAGEKCDYEVTAEMLPTMA